MKQRLLFAQLEQLYRYFTQHFSHFRSFYQLFIHFRTISLFVKGKAHVASRYLSGLDLWKHHPD